MSERSPQHIAIIMDGNGRWAEKRGMPRFLGHREGAKTVRKITTFCAKQNLKQLTLYAFSHENWQRPAKEVQFLMNLLHRFLVKERDTILKNNIRFQTIGQVHRLPEAVQKEISNLIQLSSNNTGMKLCLALSYGGRVEITDAIKSIAEQVENGKLTSQEITEETIQQHLYQPDMLEPDLLIRTAGEMRVSNFLLWQISYSEFWSTSALWPEFTEEHLQQAIDSFSKRERRFGKVPSVNKAVAAC